MSRLIKEVKSFGKSALLKIISVFIFSIFFSFSINVMAGEVPYWAGYKSQMTTDESANLSNHGLPATMHIEYSKDGQSFTAQWHFNKNEPGYGGIGKCSGKIDGWGNLEEVPCIPVEKSKKSYIKIVVLETFLIFFQNHQ